MFKKILIANRGDQQSAGLRSGEAKLHCTRSVLGD
jgi:hypothetical protein